MLCSAQIRAADSPVKVTTCACPPSTGNRYPEAYRGAGGWSREEKLRIFEPHPQIARQIEGAGEAFFEADWKDGVEDQDW
jgi:hypothetical protein